MSGLYAIRLDDGSLVTDPTWHCPADVMRSAHGHGITRMPGELVRVDSPAPKRIQRQRTRGWRMPEGAIYVGRPTEWGNPWKVGDHLIVEWPLHTAERTARELVITLALSVALYAEAFAPNAAEAIAELGGRDLACWCRLDRPCHADVLLQMANPKENR